ncbi:MptD family putative ECF transporter S component [Dethiosulfatarculus sandiegensis]|uniref:Uncharacterized protein n=1 Tax=Dethiosulfatarculus sandiegensis TaxID=1429043 RepID=A0A0D2J772_9BACT|nr:MptD family putative ECF transporter S component [Dethiosulfatarculus sandiegensis]KIX11521.1 hypothetical protein X474_23775 [Dethiosulfatarculus sandiegensis]
MNSSPAQNFIPASDHLVKSGCRSGLRDWVVLSILNGLLLGLSHLIYFTYVFAGPGAVVLNFYHQAVESLLLASVYLMMAYVAPKRRPFTKNAFIWGVMGLLMGWWPILPVAIPAGLLADRVIRWAVPKRRHGWVLITFAFYATMLCLANYWPLFLTSFEAVIKRLSAMHQIISQLVAMLTLPVLGSMLAATFGCALLGGYMAQRLIIKHFAWEDSGSC